MARDNPNPNNIGKRVIRSVGGGGDPQRVAQPGPNFRPGKRVIRAVGGSRSTTGGSNVAGNLQNYLNLKATGSGGKAVKAVIGGPRSQGRLKY